MCRLVNKMLLNLNCDTICCVMGSEQFLEIFFKYLDTKIGRRALFVVFLTPSEEKQKNETLAVLELLQIYLPTGFQRGSSQTFLHRDRFYYPEQISWGWRLASGWSHTGTENQTTWTTRTQNWCQGTEKRTDKHTQNPTACRKQWGGCGDVPGVTMQLWRSNTHILTHTHKPVLKFSEGRGAGLSSRHPDTSQTRIRVSVSLCFSRPISRSEQNENNVCLNKPLDL